MNKYVLGTVGADMSDEKNLNWEPTESDVDRSELESKLATTVENKSLEVLRNVDDAPLEMDDLAATKRSERPDLRLEASDSERKNIDLFMSIWGWVIVGGALALTLGIAAFFGWLRWLIFW